MCKMNRKAVTLVELLVVVLILAALSAIAIPRISHSAQTAKFNACDTNVDVINSAIELSAAENNGSYPLNQSALDLDVLGDTDIFPDGSPACPLSGTYTYNATTKRVSCNHP